jgi:putative transposase
VADLAKQDKLEGAEFRPDAPVSYDTRMLTWDLEEKTVSIWTVHGRKTIRFDCGPHQLELLRFQRGDTDLLIFEDNFYLFALCEVEDLSPVDVQGVWE